VLHVLHIREWYELHRKREMNPMRLWTVHPRYLDSKGLVALWREGLLAQKVLCGKTIGYRHHPQLIRFQVNSNSQAAIATYLAVVLKEAKRRGFNFNSRKIIKSRMRGKITVTNGQLLYEWRHLKRKLRVRDIQKYQLFKLIDKPKPHPLFRIIPGPLQAWERVK
jgi:hypothetical protein